MNKTFHAMTLTGGLVLSAIGIFPTSVHASKNAYADGHTIDTHGVHLTEGQKPGFIKTLERRLKKERALGKDYPYRSERFDPEKLVDQYYRLKSQGIDILRNHQLESDTPVRDKKYFDGAKDLALMVPGYETTENGDVITNSRKFDMSSIYVYLNKGDLIETYHGPKNFKIVVKQISKDAIIPANSWQIYSRKYPKEKLERTDEKFQKLVNQLFEDPNVRQIQVLSRIFNQPSAKVYFSATRDENSKILKRQTIH